MQMQHQSGNLSEQDLLNDLLNQEKLLMGSYSTFISEASCPKLRGLLEQGFKDVAGDQYKIFDMMRQKGYYQAKDAQDADVQQAKQSMQQLQQQLNVPHTH